MIITFAQLTNCNIQKIEKISKRKKIDPLIFEKKKKNSTKRFTS